MSPLTLKLCLAAALFAAIVCTGARAWGQDARPSEDRMERPDQQVPKDLANIEIIPKLGASVPLDVELKDGEGRPVRLSKFAGDKPILMVLAYYECPMLCSMVLNGVLEGMK